MRVSKLALVHETNYHNQNERYKIRKIVLMASHPHHIFYHSCSSYITEQQEMIMRAAALIVNYAVPFVENCFLEKKWHSHIPSVAQQIELGLSGRYLQKRSKFPTQLSLTNAAAWRKKRRQEPGLSTFC
jgi:hypothetical protein